MTDVHVEMQMPSDVSAASADSPFDEVNSMTLSHLIGFIEAHDGLCFAKTNRRNYSVYKSTSNKRPFKDLYEAYLGLSTDNKSNSSKLVLSNLPDKKAPHRRITLKFVNKPSPKLRNEPDLVIADGEIVVHVGFDLAIDRTMTWRCFANGCSKRDATLSVFKYLAQRISFNQLYCFEIDSDTLSFVGAHSPSSIQAAYLYNVKTVNENDILRFIEKMPGLLAFWSTGVSAFSKKLFENDCVRRLREFGADMSPCAITDENIGLMQWETFKCKGATQLSPQRIATIFKDWKLDRHEIVSWRFAIPLKIEDFHPTAELILGGRNPHNNHPSIADALAKSKSGKRMAITTFHENGLMNIVCDTKLADRFNF